MHPVISISIYCFMQTAVLLLSVLGLRRKRIFRAGWFAGVCLCIYILLSALPVAGAMLPDSRVKFILQGAGNIWLGFSTYFNGLMILLFLAAGLICLAGRRRMPGRLPMAILTVSLTVSTVLLVYGLVHAQNTVVKEYDITIEKDAGEHKDLKLVLLGDLHLSVNTYYPTIRRMVDLVNEQHADAVVIAGDIFTSSYQGLKDPERYAALLRQMDSTWGTFAVYGNHDVEETLFGGFPISPISRAFRTKEMEGFFRDCGFTILYDETVSIADGMIQIVGRVDGEKAGDGTALRLSPSQLLADSDLKKPVLVLEHEPVEFEALKENGADLALCGHTHAGQIFPGNLIVPLFNENAYGYKEVAGLQTIVTSGVGYYGPPMRVGTNSEVSVVNIHFTGNNS